MIFLSLDINQEQFDTQQKSLIKLAKKIICNTFMLLEILGDVLNKNSLKTSLKLRDLLGQTDNLQIY